MDEEFLNGVKSSILAAGMHSAGMNMPDPNTRIWRYMKFRDLEDLLYKERLYFSRADKVSDSNEGQLPRSIKETLEVLLPHIHRNNCPNSLEYLMEREEKGLRQYKLAIFLSCWHLDDNETEDRWEQHRDREIAIQSTYLKFELASYEKRMKRYEVSCVHYIDHENDFVSQQHPFTIYVQKAKQFEFEKELRAITYSPAMSMNEGVYIPVSIENLLEQIVISPRASEQVRIQALDLISRYQPKIPVRDSKFRIIA